MEFKGTQRAEEYVNNAFFDSGENKNIDKCFKNFAKGGFLDGYNQALEDTKSKEMLEMLQDSVEVIKWYMENAATELHEPFFNIGANQIEQTEQLIKQITEL